MVDLARAYDEWHSASAPRSNDPRETRLSDWELDLLGATSDRALLDVACGTGGFLVRARERGLVVTGIDISPVAVEVARGRLPGATVREGDGEHLPFPDASFDYVTCLGSLEHFPDAAAGVRELARVVRPAGRVLVFVPNLFFVGHVWLGIRHGIEPSEGNQQFSERFMSSRGWQELLESHGLHVESCHPWNTIWATRKVNRLTVATWNALARLVPRNAAYAFAFVCGRA